jgi:integrase
VACYNLPNGDRKQVSTGLTGRVDDKNEALQIALKLEHAGNLAKRGTLTRQRVLALLDEIAGAAGMNSLVSPDSPREFIGRYLKLSQASVSKGTGKRYGDYVDQFYAGIGSAANKPMAFVDTALLSKWRDDRLMKGISPATIKNQIVYLKSAFREALSQGVIIEDPFKELTPAKPARKGKIKQPFTKEQFEDLLRSNSGEWRVLILLAFYTGQRDRDCRLLTWDMVDFAKGEIRFQRRKTHDTFTAPMHPRLLRHLRLWQSRGRGRGVVLPELSAMLQTGTAGFPQVFRFEILPLIGINQPYSKGPGRTPSKYSFHSFRHSLSTVLNEAGVSEVDRMAIVGHTDKSVNRGYTHTRSEHLRSQLAKV